jgi:hypothetical protein
MGELVMPPTYRILHLTDFHFDPKKIEDQKIIVSELKNDLARIGSEKSVDLRVCPERSRGIAEFSEH